MITAQQVKELRERTGVGMMDCKRALNEANGDMIRLSSCSVKKGWPLRLRRPDASLPRALSRRISIWAARSA